MSIRGFSGVADHLAENDAHALAILRRIVGNLNRSTNALGGGEEPLFMTREEIYGIIPTDARHPYDVREVIARIVDGSRFDEFKARYGTTLVTGFARFYGAPVGVIANNGILFGESRAKGSALHRTMLAARHSPDLPAKHHRLHGRAQIRKRRHRQDGAKMVTAVSTAQVPKFTMVIGGSFGAGNYGMCGRAYAPAFSVDVAQQPHFRDGRRTGGERSGARAARRVGGPGWKFFRRGGGGVQGADPRAI